jgi:hypothetical protein
MPRIVPQQIPRALGCLLELLQRRGCSGAGQRARLQSVAAARQSGALRGQRRRGGKSRDIITMHMFPMSFFLVAPQVLIAYGLRRNSTIIYINLNMNPIGRNGAQAMLRHQVTLLPPSHTRAAQPHACKSSASSHVTSVQRVGRSGDPRNIRLERCNLDAASSMTFNPNNPNGKYRYFVTIFNLRSLSKRHTCRVLYMPHILHVT